MMRRTIGFIVTLALALLVAPLAAQAPPAGKVYRIAFLFAGSPTRPTMSTAIQEAFRQRLHELGWIHGQNLAVEFRWAEWRFERLPALATELVQLPVDLIAVGSGLELLAAKQATRTIPIVMVLALDAVEQGFVASLAQPGANVTGVTAMTADLQPEAPGAPEGTGPGQLSHGGPRVSEPRPRSGPPHASRAGVGSHAAHRPRVGRPSATPGGAGPPMTMMRPLPPRSARGRRRWLSLPATSTCGTGGGSWASRPAASTDRVSSPGSG